MTAERKLSGDSQAFYIWREDGRSTFINAAHLCLSIKMTEETKATKMAWMLSYI